MTIPRDKSIPRLNGRVFTGNESINHRHRVGQRSVCRSRRCLSRRTTNAVCRPMRFGIRSSERGRSMGLRPGWYTLIKPSRVKSRRRSPFRAKRCLLANFQTVRRLLVTRYSTSASAHQRPRVSRQTICSRSNSLAVAVVYDDVGLEGRGEEGLGSA